MKKIKKLVTWVVALAMCFSLTGVSGLTSVTAFAAGSNYQVNLQAGGSDTFDNWDEALSYLESGGGGDLWLLQDVTIDSTLVLSGEVTMNLDGHTITINSSSDPAIRVESGASWIINCSCTDGSGGVKNTGSGLAVEVNGALWLACGTYESGSGSTSTITGSGTVTFGNLGNAANCLPTVINDNSAGRCFSSDLTVNAQVGMFIPGDNDAEISGTYRVSNVLNGQDGYVVGTLSMTFDEDDTNYENPIVILTAAATGTQYTLTADSDYVLGDKIVSDDSVGYMVTPTNRTDTLLTYSISSGDDDTSGDDASDDEDNSEDGNEGYYVSETGGYIPGTLDVTLDDNNEAVVTVTAADGTVYTLTEGTDYVVSYEEVDGTYVVTVTLLDENGDAYDEYEFGFTLYYVSEVGGWIPGTLDVTLDDNNEAVVTVTASDGTVYTLVEGVDYTVTYTETDEGLLVTVTLLDENGDAYATYEFVFDLGANATDIVKTDDSSRVWMYTILAMAAAAAVALVLAGNKKYAGK